MNKGRKIVLVLSAMMLFAGGCFAATLEETVSEYKYVINLATSPQPIKTTPFTQQSLRHYTLYTVKDNTGDKIQYHLRLGFFKTQEEAYPVFKIADYNYLDAGIDTVKSSDLPIVKQWLIAQFPALATQATPAGNQDLYLKEYMQLANQAMQDRNYLKAIGIYTKIIEYPPNQYQQDALENLGLAREKNNQLAHAMAEYRLYLNTYPTTEGAARVKRRLDNLVAQQTSAAFITNNSQTRSSDNKWIHYGNLYQFYYNDTLERDDTNTLSEKTLLTTYFNYTGRAAGNSAPMEANITFTHVHDIDNSENDKERLTSLYFDMTSDNRLFDMRAGRQKNKTSSVFNRYDGIDLGYLMSPDYKARFTYGYPVEFYETVENRTDKYFYALGLEIKPNSKAWHTSIFYLEQQADGILDRQELAIDTKYLNATMAFYTSLDYSLQYEEVNFFMASLNQHYADNSTFNLVADYRTTPFLTTTNALQGQVGVSSLTDLLSTLTLDEIEQLSMDRTANYQSLSAYYSKYMMADLQITADLTASSMSGTVASQGVAALQDTGNEYSYSIGLIRQHLFMPNDQNIINLRFSELVNSDAMLLNLSSILRLDQAWRINPKLKYDTRDYSDGRNSTAIRPAISIKNKINKYWQLEFEAAYEDKETDIPNSTSLNETSKLLYAGYILTF